MDKRLKTKVSRSFLDELVAVENLLDGTIQENEKLKAEIECLKDKLKESNKKTRELEVVGKKLITLQKKIDKLSQKTTIIEELPGHKDIKIQYLRFFIEFVVPTVNNFQKTNQFKVFATIVKRMIFEFINYSGDRCEKSVIAVAFEGYESGLFGRDLLSYVLREAYGLDKMTTELLNSIERQAVENNNSIEGILLTTKIGEHATLVNVISSFIANENRLSIANDSSHYYDVAAVLNIANYSEIEA